MDAWTDTARRLNQARRAGRPLGSFPGPLPPDLASAYALQEEVIAEVGDSIAGWKIGFIEPKHRASYAAERLIGPVLAASIYRASASAEVEVPVFDGGSAALEAEFAVRVDWDPAQERCPPPERLHVFCAVEVASSPLANLAQLGPGAIIGDRGNNAGMVIGPPVGSWSDLMLRPIETFVDIDGRRAGTGGVENVPGGVAGSLAVLIEHLEGRGRSLARGDWVLTGATTGAHAITPGQRALAGFSGLGAIAIRAVAAG